MKCKRGIYVASQDQTVPCGQCLPCRINKGRLWTSRILQETCTHPEYSWFLTFTYREDSVPTTLDVDGNKVLTLRKKAFLKWLNNQQRPAAVGPFRYYAVGEYGEDTHRPHYHLAIFPQSFEQVRSLCAAWEKAFGYTQGRIIDGPAARYLANYTAKKLNKAVCEERGHAFEPEFRSSSRNPPLGYDFAGLLVRKYSSGVGKRFVEERGDISRTFRLDGKVYPISSYVLNKARKELGIPLLHRERAGANPNYLEYFGIEPTEYDWEESKCQEIQINAKAKRKKLSKDASRV